MPSFLLRLPGLNNHVASLECQSMLFFSPHLPTANKLLNIKCASVLTPHINKEESRGVAFMVDSVLRHGLMQKKIDCLTTTNLS